MNIQSMATPGWEPTPTVSRGLTLVAVTGVFWWIGGLGGVALGAGLGLFLFVLPVVFVFALGQVVLAALLSPEPVLTAVVLGELPLLLFLGTTVDRPQSWRRVLISLLVGGGVLATSVIIVATVRQLWLGSLGIVGAAAVTTYATHRYAVVVLEERGDE